MSDRGIIDTVVPLGGSPRIGARRDMPGTRANTLEGLLQDLEGDALKGLWTVQAKVDAPAATAAHVWKWQTLRGHLDRAGELMKLTDSPVRRALLLWNPGARDHWDTTNTLTAAVQMMQPGETVNTHRHIHSALRFITHGRGATTTVNGERIVLSAGDLVLTPNWHWHDHANDSAGEVIWMDGLDRTLVKLLDAIYFEGWPGGGYQPVTSFDDGTGPGVPPGMGAAGDRRFSAQLAWRWNDILSRLRHLEKTGAASPFDDLIEVFRNPATGAHVTPTIGCAIQMLRPGVHTKAHRHTTSAVYHVFRGRGYSVIDGRRHDWSEGDYLALPHRAWHEHANASSSEPAILFSLTDEPAFDALALRREEHWTHNHGWQIET